VAFEIHVRLKRPKKGNRSRLVPRLLDVDQSIETAIEDRLEFLQGCAHVTRLWENDQTGDWSRNYRPPRGEASSTVKSRVRPLNSLSPQKSGRAPVCKRHIVMCHLPPVTRDRRCGPDPGSPDVGLDT
jgi:hypothetical protein